MCLTDDKLSQCFDHRVKYGMICLETYIHLMHYDLFMRVDNAKELSFVLHALTFCKFLDTLFYVILPAAKVGRLDFHRS